MHYVIGDVHGCYDEMMLLLQKIEKSDPEAQFIFVGDFIDRGPKVWDVLEWAMENITKDGKYQSVRGNHEQLVIEWYLEFVKWCKEKGYETEEPMPNTRYDFTKWLNNMNYTNPAKILPIIEFFHSLPFSKVVTVKTKFGKNLTYRIVHGWYNYEEPQDSEKQQHCNLWERNYWGKQENDEVIVHGHTPTISLDYRLRGFECDVPGMIGYRTNAINVDGGCCYFYQGHYASAMLCGICLETLEEFYPYTLEERFVQNEKVFGKKFNGVSYSDECIEEVAKYMVEEFEADYMGKVSMPRKQILRKMRLEDKEE